MQKIFCLFLLLISSTWGFAQSKVTVFEILEAIKGFYDKHEIVYQKVDYQLYPSHDAELVHSTEKGMMVISGQKKYAQLGVIESWTDGNYTIGIDNDEQTLMVGNIVHVAPTAPIVDIEPLLDYVEDIEMTDLADGLKLLSMTTQIGEVERLSIEFRAKDYRLERMVFFYRRKIQLEAGDNEEWVKTRMEIVYTNTLTNGMGREKLNRNLYAIRQKSDWKPTGKYADYELINNIIQTEKPN